MTRNSLILHTMGIAVLNHLGTEAVSRGSWLAASALLVVMVATCVWFENRLTRAGAVFT